MTHHVAAIEGRFRVFRHIGDRHRLYVGPWFTSRKEAARYADTLARPRGGLTTPDLAGLGAESRDEVGQPAGSPVDASNARAG